MNRIDNFKFLIIWWQTEPKAETNTKVTRLIERKFFFKRLIDDMITFLPVVKPSYTVYTLVQSDLQSQSTTNEPVLQQLVR